MPSMRIPIRTVSGANAREHWAKRAARAKKERTTVRLFLLRMISMMPKFDRYVVDLTRNGKRFLDDDNLAISFKAIRDEIAELLGFGDSPTDPVRWTYGQTKSREYSVTITVEGYNGREDNR